MHQRFDRVHQPLAENCERMAKLEDSINGLQRLDSIHGRLDELTAEVSLQRAALERFGYMRKRPTPPEGGYAGGGGSGVPTAAKGK